MPRIFEVTVIVRERRRYVVEAEDRDDAEGQALDGMGEFLSTKTEILDELVHETRDVTADYQRPKAVGE